MLWRSFGPTSSLPSIKRICVEKGTSMAETEKLHEAVKRYEYTKKKKIKLYGKELELVSDPVHRQEDDVFVDSREEGTDNIREVQVPRNVVQMAKGSMRKESR